MAERDDIERLRDEYKRLAEHEPRAEIDAAIRDAARRHVVPRRLRVWSAALASAACIGLAIVLVPALLVEAPAPVAMQESERMVRVKSEEAEQKTRQAQAERESTARRARPMVAAPAPPASVAPDRYLADQADARTEPGSSTASAAVMAEQAAPPVNPDALRTLREELRAADEATWRRRLLELRAAGREPLAAALLEDFRARFGRDADFTLDDLAAEAPSGK